MLNPRSRQEQAWLVSVFCSFAIGFLPSPAFADAAGELGSVVCNISENLAPYANFISVVAYVVGAFLVGNGIIMLKRHTEGVSGATVNGGVLRLIAGSGSLSLPIFAGVIQNSVVGGVNGAGSTGAVACTPGAVGTISDGTASLDVLFANLINNIHTPMQTVLSVLCIVMGAFMIAKGLLRASKYGSDQRSTVPNIVINLAIGAVLISVGQMMDIVMGSVLGTSTISEFSGVNWSTVSTDSESLEKVNKVIESVLVFIQVIGMIAFIRGWMIIKAAVEGGQGTIPQGTTHIIAGAMCINIFKMLEVFDNTFGLNILN